MRLVVALLVTLGLSAALADPLPSWSEGRAKEAITAFVTDVTDPSGQDFVAPTERIAVFDNDGTLWAEQPLYTQLAFVWVRLF